MSQRTNQLVPPDQDNKVNDDINEMKHKSLHSVSQRLQKELMTLMLSQDQTVSGFPDNDNLFMWKATIKGPENTVFSGFTYKLTMEFPSGYPFSPPVVKFLTPCFHPNVDPLSGNICLDILKDKWSPLLDVRSILVSIQSLLGDPNNASPLNLEAAEKWSNPDKFKKALSAFQNQSQ